MNKLDLETTLLRVAAAMLEPGVFLSPFREDHPKRMPRRILKAAEAQQEQLQRWATELAAAARSLRKANDEITRDEKLTAMIEWLTQYQEGWHGPKDKWTAEVRADFDRQAGFLMMFIDGYKFTKQNDLGLSRAEPDLEQH